VTVISAREVGDSEREQWSRIQASDPSYASPCLAPQFTCAIAAKRDDIFVGVLEEASRITGFFPFQRTSLGGASPSKRRMADYEAVIVRADVEWSAEALLRGCGLVGWEFETLIASQAQLQPYHRETSTSPILDLRRGFEAYESDIRGTGSRLLKKLHWQRRALEREHGPVRYEPHVADVAALHWLMRCKSAQYRRTGVRDHFATPRIAAVVERVHGTQDTDFAGSLSVLYAGDEMVAGHLGARSPSVWHYWFPSYDRRFAKYSPGSLLLIEMAKSAESIGMRYIDLGQGLEEYKLRFMNGSVAIAAGSIVLR